MKSLLETRQTYKVPSKYTTVYKRARKGTMSTLLDLVEGRRSHYSAKKRAKHKSWRNLL